MTENKKQDAFEVPIHSMPPPLLRVYGTHYEMGQQIGESRRENVKNSIENARKLLDEAYRELELTWEGAQIQARKYLPFAQERYPQYIEEMQGIADGADVSFDDLAVLTALEAVTRDALHLTNCTSMAVNSQRTSDGHVLLAHNEDWIPEDEGDVYILHAQPKNEPAFLAITYGGLLPNIGFNVLGIAQLIDSVFPNDARIGIPRVIVSRAVLAAKSPSEAIQKAIVAKRAAGYNHMIAHESGEIYSVEVSANSYEILYALDGYMVHSNHYLSAKMREFESIPEMLVPSHVQYYRALHLMLQTPKHTIKTMQTIQKDHVDFPSSICNHANSGDPLDREKTICAIVIDLNMRELHLAWGNPCRNQYHTFHLDG